MASPGSSHVQGDVSRTTNESLRSLMLDVLDSRHYFPQFIWNFFLNNIGPRWQPAYRVHVYDVFTDHLHETRRIPQSKTIFADFHSANLAEECLAAIKGAEDAFARLETEVETILAAVLRKLAPPRRSPEPTVTEGSSGKGKGKEREDGEEQPRRRTLWVEARAVHTLLKYLVFLRFRNSEQYHETVLALGKKASQSHPWMRLIPRGPLRRRAVLRSICAFLDHALEVVEARGGEDTCASGPAQHAEYFADIEEHCWRPIREGTSEISFGIASEAQEFLSTEKSFGNLDDLDPDGSCDGSFHLFLPITPSVAVYLVTRAPQLPGMPTPIPMQMQMASRSIVSKSSGSESPGESDIVTVFLRKRKRSTDVVNQDEGPRTPPKRSKTLPSEAESTISLKRKRDNDRDALNIRPTPKHSRTDSALLSSTLGVLYDPSTSELDQTPQAPSLIPILCDTESVPDVHIRNSILLRTSPRYILFSSLPSLVTAITVSTPPSSSYSSSSSSSHNQYSSASTSSWSRLKTACREKHIREGLMKTLLVKGDVPVTDLTEDVKLYGESAVEHGSFADIWKGEWVERAGLGLGGGKKKIIAMKVLRQFMIDNVKEKVLKRLKDEVLTWHRLHHPHIAPLYGIVQLPHHLAMVSPWCDNGTVVRYLKEVNPSADRFVLMQQIASGVAYLHDFKPVVIHGDLKGNNILVDNAGKALITDFGVSKVIEDFSPSSLGSGSGQPQPPQQSSLQSSFFGGATRWMAPELILALVEDDSGCDAGDGSGGERRKGPQLTKMSDVYAFAAVCLEIMTGQLPYPARTNPHAVTVDKMRGIKPSSGINRQLQDSSSSNVEIEEAFWQMMDRCWDEWYLRPTMQESTIFFEGLVQRRAKS